MMINQKEIFENLLTISVWRIHKIMTTYKRYGSNNSGITNQNMSEF